MARIGYARDAAQDINIQTAALTEAGCDTIQAEAPDGANALTALFDYTIGEGDILVVTQFDRLAQSMTDLQTIAGQLDERGAYLATIVIINLVRVLNLFQCHSLMCTHEGVQNGKDLHEGVIVRLMRSIGVHRNKGTDYGMAVSLLNC